MTTTVKNVEETCAEMFQRLDVKVNFRKGKIAEATYKGDILGVILGCTWLGFELRKELYSIKALRGVVKLDSSLSSSDIYACSEVIGDMEAEIRYLMFRYGLSFTILCVKDIIELRRRKKH